MKKQNNDNFCFKPLKLLMIFQLKLGLDALRDVLLSPVSIIAMLLDIVLRHDPKQSYFLRLMHFGRLSDHWINLFGIKQPFQKHRSDSVDHWLSQIEGVIKEQQSDGKLSESAKSKIEQYMAKISKKDSLNIDAKQGQDKGFNNDA
jgi:hypothetical protein